MLMRQDLVILDDLGRTAPHHRRMPTPIKGGPMLQMFSTPPVRPSPFYALTVAEGMAAANVYNRMIMPISFGNLTCP